MATATVTNILTTPAGQPVTDCAVSASLWPRQQAFTPAGGAVAPVATTTSNVQGTWSLSLERTDTMSPGGMLYQVQEVSVSTGLNTISYIFVPAGGGALRTLLVWPQTAPAGGMALTSLIGGRGIVISGSAPALTIAANYPGYPVAMFPAITGVPIFADGVNDDAPGLQAAINWAALQDTGQGSSNVGGLILLDARTYRLASTLLLKPGVGLAGQGKNRTWLNPTTGGAGTVGVGLFNARAGASPPAATLYTLLADLTILSINTIGTALDLSCAQQCTLRGVRLSTYGGNPTGTGILLRGYRDSTSPASASVACQLNKLINVDVFNHLSNLVCVGGDGGPAANDYYGSCNDNSFVNCFFSGYDGLAGSVNVWLKQRATQQHFATSLFYHGTTCIMQVDDSYNDWLDCAWEFSGGDGIRFTSGVQASYTWGAGGPNAATTSARNAVLGGMTVKSNIAGSTIVDSGTENDWLLVDDGQQPGTGHRKSRLNSLIDWGANGDTAARSTGAGSILFKDATNRNNAGMLSIVINGTTYYVPFFAAP